MTSDQLPLHATQIVRDDALLDALVRGAVPPVDDELAVLLGAWRADLDVDLPTTESGRAVAIDAARRRRRLRTIIVVAVAVAGIGGGATAAAAQAGPGSPLWPITKILFPQQAESRVAEKRAEEAIDRARDAIEEQRYADAEQLLAEATEYAGQLADAGVVSRLLDQIAVVQGLLPGLPGGEIGEAIPSPSAFPSYAGPGEGTQTTPSPTATTSGGILPPLPPSLSIPPLPTTLPPILG